MAIPTLTRRGACNHNATTTHSIILHSLHMSACGVSLGELPIGQFETPLLVHPTFYDSI
jgi:hypothetical protein